MLYVPASLFHDFQHNRYPLTRAYVGECLRALLPDGFPISVQAPLCLEVVLRQKDGQRQIHFVNRASGLPNVPDSGAIDEIPAVGPVTVQFRGQAAAPRTVRLAFSEQHVDVRHDPAAATLTVRIPAIAIHDTLVVE